MKTAYLITLIGMLSSCAYLQSVSQTSIPRNKSKKVTAKVERNIILLLNFSNEYLTDLTAQLANQCPNGPVKGILTKDEVVTYFPVIWHKSIVTAQGYCVEGRRSSRRKRR